jgi:hypothetical protein
LLLLLLLHVHTLLHTKLLLPSLLPLLLIGCIAAGIHIWHHGPKPTSHHHGVYSSKGRVQRHAPKPCCHGWLCCGHHHVLLLLLQHLQGLVPVVVDHGRHLQPGHMHVIIWLEVGATIPTCLLLLLL